MKKTVKVLAIVLSMLMLTLCLASCGDLSGTYEWGDEEYGMELKFSGSKVTLTVLYDDEEYSIEGEYELNDDEDEITFTFDEDDIEELEDDDDAPSTVISTIKNINDEEMDFKEGDDYIKIDGLKFKEK